MPAVILDTDIGSDVDDALALAMLLGSPEVDLVAVTTVYGDTLLRARLARRLLRLGGRHPTPVLAGATTPLSGREVWWAGHEGASFPDLDDERVDPGADAVDHLVTAVAERPGEIDVLAVGPLTNIALALERDPAFEVGVRSLHVMGGHFGPDPVSEHNILCDVDAAARVFSSGARITVTGLDVTTTVRLDAAHVQRIAAAGPLGAALQREIETFWRFSGHAWNTPHDPVAAAAMLLPDLFTTAPLDVAVDTTTEALGVTRTSPPSRRTLVTTGTRSGGGPRVVEEIVDRVCAAAPLS